MYEVLADQAVWAICGRSSAVVDMSRTKKQIIVVEVMPLVGGHLSLPKIRLSKYIPNDGEKGEKNIPKLEPFHQGQIYNATKYSQVHVLSSGASGGGSAAQAAIPQDPSKFQSLSTKTLLSHLPGPISLP